MVPVSVNVVFGVLGISSAVHLSSFQPNMSFVNGHSGRLSGGVVSVLVSHGEGWWFQSGWRRPSHPSVEMGTWNFLELGKERRTGIILTISLSSVQMAKYIYS